MSEEASTIAGKYLCEKTNIKDRDQDYSEDPLYMYRLKSRSVKSYSMNELRIGALNFVLHARCIQRRFKEEERNRKKPLIPI